MATSNDVIECMVERCIKALPESYKTRTGDVRAVCAARVYGVNPVAGQPYDTDLSRMFNGFKNPDGSSLNSYDKTVLENTRLDGFVTATEGGPIYENLNMAACGFGTGAGAAPKNWRGGSGNP